LLPRYRCVLVRTGVIRCEATELCIYARQRSQ